MISSTRLCGLKIVLDAAGLAYIPEFRALIAADLHLEKASHFARRGRHLPPYDTTATLAVLRRAIATHRPHRFIALGDNFHDVDGPDRLGDDDLAALKAIAGTVPVTWITGNHDPVLPAFIGGTIASEVHLGPLVLRHHPQAAAHGEIAGHLHPCASVVARGRRVRCKCFASDARRLILPSLGAFTGGLSVRAPAIASLFDSDDFHVWMLSQTRLHRFAASRLSRHRERTSAAAP